MQTKPILTRQEAAIRAELGAKFPLCNLSDLYQTEVFEFRHCFGMATYEKMRDALADYSNADPWMSQSYTAGTVVIKDGVFWQAKQTTTTEPLAENEYWGLAPKFDDTDCGQLYNELWCDYLARYLALKVAIITIGRQAVTVSGQGVTRNSGNGFIPADAKEIGFLLDGLKLQATQTFDNMEYWLASNKTDTCFPAETCNDKCTDIKADCGCKSGDCSGEKPQYAGISVY